MAGANFHGLANIYGEDVLRKVKGCEFHYKQSVEKKTKTLGEKGEGFRQIANRLLYATTPESYTSALDAIKSFFRTKRRQRVERLDQLVGYEEG